MSDETPRSDGPRRLDVARHALASVKMRAKAMATVNPEQRRQHLAEADRLMGIAHDLAKSDRDAAEFERRVKAGGGVWFPKDGI